jgi:transcriptional regulator with XRE-family HTH domain
VILKRRRLEKEMSLTRLAEKAGLSRQMVSYVERGLRIPGLDTLMRICRVMDLDAADVLRRAQRGSSV